MYRSFKPIAAAATLALLQLSHGAFASGAPTTKVPTAAPADRPPLAMRSTDDWITYDDTTFTPVADEVSRRLRAAGTAFDAKDNAKAGAELRAAADALRGQLAEAAKQGRKLGGVADQRLEAAIGGLDGAAANVEQGRMTTRAQFDGVFDVAMRSDLDSRWLETDSTTWYPVTDEPQKHFSAAAAAYARKDYKASAMEIRRSVAYLRLEASRSTGQGKRQLDRSLTGLDRLADAAGSGAVSDDRALDRAFARADHALALAHRERAAKSWSEKKYVEVGYEMKAGAQGLDDAATWIGDRSSAGAHEASIETRRVGDELASGAQATRAEVVNGLSTLGHGIERLGHEIDSGAHDRTAKTGA